MTVALTMDVAAIDKAIRLILTADGVDLSTISSKRVRKALSDNDAFGPSLVKANKEVSGVAGIAAV